MSPSPRRRAARILALCTAAVIVAALGAPAYAAQTVKMTNTDRFMPASLAISRGVKVVWSNTSNKTHNVVSYKGDWNVKVRVNSGQRTSFTFNNNGTYKYRCTIQSHSSLNNGTCNGMCGRITVG